jgi:hypothetical protein
MAAFKSIIDQFDGSTELAEAQREALETLAQLAETKRDLFAKEINLLILDAGTGTNKTVPISRIDRTDGMARAFSATSVNDISETLKKALSGFLEGGTDNILAGIFDLLSKTLEIFLGSTSGSDDFRKQYFVFATDFAIYRVDVFAWSRTVTAKSLKQKISQATAYSYCLSNVDTSKISFSDFAAIFALQLDEVKNITAEERKEARARMRETWEFITGNAPTGAEVDATTSYAKILGEYSIPLQSY